GERSASIATRRRCSTYEGIEASPCQVRVICQNRCWSVKSREQFLQPIRCSSASPRSIGVKLPSTCAAMRSRYVSHVITYPLSRRGVRPVEVGNSPGGIRFHVHIPPKLPATLVAPVQDASVRSQSGTQPPPQLLHTSSLAYPLKETSFGILPVVCGGPRES